MTELSDDGFARGEEGDLAAFAATRAADLDLSIPDICRPGVLENLGALRDHARIVAAWLETESLVAEAPP